MNYELHDYEIDSVEFEDNKIIFSFPNGFYVEDDQGCEVKPSRRKLVFTINKGCCSDSPSESFISIRRITRRGKKWKEISFQQFKSLFKKGNMFIYDEYDSKSDDCKMLQINTNTKWNVIEFFITDIENVECPE